MMHDMMGVGGMCGGMGRRLLHCRISVRPPRVYVRFWVNSAIPVMPAV
jgi:hypothetical protein